MHESAVRYRYDHELRFRKYYTDGGEYFLDAGCGGEPRPEMASDFRRHVCVDVSIKGLIEAKSQLGDSGDYVLADLNSLPFKDQSFDGVLASHCLYHIEKNSQVGVVSSLYRVTAKDKTILIFYSSRYNVISAIHKIPLLILPLINQCLRLLGIRLTTNPPYIRQSGTKGEIAHDGAPPLYSFAHNPMKLVKGYKFANVSCLMALTNYDTQLLRRFRLLKIVLPALNFFECAFPNAMRYFGKYTCLRIVKNI